jgi:hypothetical protein
MRLSMSLGSSIGSKVKTGLKSCRFCMDSVVDSQLLRWTSDRGASKDRVTLTRPMRYSFAPGR